MNPLTPQTYPPWVIAHRGFSSDYPENTLAAFDAAAAGPIQGIELDIQLTRDLVAVVYHDRTLLGIGGGRRRVRNQDWRTLARFETVRSRDRGPSRHIPLLDQVLARYGRRCLLLLEVKRREKQWSRLQCAMDRVIEAIHRHDMRERAWILCYDLPLLEYGYERDPSLRFVWNQDKPRFEPGADFLFAYSVNIKNLNEKIVHDAHKVGKPVLTFTCNTPKQLARALSYGVNGIMSDNPHWLVENLATHTREGA